MSDRSIREAIAAGRIQLDPFDPDLVQPASVDMRLDRYFRVFLNHTMPVIDVKKNLEELTQLIEIPEDQAFVLHPGEFVLGSTLEHLGLPDDLVGRVEGKSGVAGDSGSRTLGPTCFGHRDGGHRPGGGATRWCG